MATLDPALLKKLSERTVKDVKYLREQISKKASAAHVSSAAYLVFWASRIGIGTARHFSTLDPHIQEQIRSLAETPVSRRPQATPIIQKMKKLVRARPSRPSYVDPKRLQEIRNLRITRFDLTRLAKMCEELNHCFGRGDFIATIALVRSILNHVPPIFENNNFNEVRNNLTIAKSNRESLDFLSSHSRKIADAYLHIPVRNSETLPTRTQVDFSQSLDVLLGEIARRLKND